MYSLLLFDRKHCACFAFLQSFATLALVAQASNDDQLGDVRLSSARLLAAIWQHCLCGQSTQEGDTNADHPQLVTAYWKVFLQCLFDTGAVVRETAWLCLLNISQHLMVSEGIVDKEGTYESQISFNYTLILYVYTIIVPCVVTQ